MPALILRALTRLEAGQTKLRTDFLDELGKTRADAMGKVTKLRATLSRPATISA
jgi:hypothetical protein